MSLFTQIVPAVLLILLGGFFAGSETGVYRLSRFKLRVAIQQKKRFAGLLEKAVRDRHGLVLSMLTGNNLANYLVTSLVTYIIFTRSEGAGSAELQATLIMTPVLFIFVDIIPKTIYYYRADVLMINLSPLIWFFQKLFRWSGTILLLKKVSRFLNRSLGLTTEVPAAITTTGRHQVEQIIHETREEGILSPVQRQIMHRLVKAPGVIIKNVMVPLADVEMLPVNTSKKALMDYLRTCPYSRVVVYDGAKSNITGFIDICSAAACEEDFSSIEKFVTPLPELSETATVIKAVNLMRKSNHKLCIVMQHRHPKTPERKPLGIITIKDLVEELTGQISAW